MRNALRDLEHIEEEFILQDQMIVERRLDRLERWAVVAYIRALQRAYRGTIDDVPESARRKLLQP